MNHHPAYPDRLMDESLLFPQGVSPPPHATQPGHPGATVNQLLRRAAAAAAMRRERNNSAQSDEVSLKRHRGMDSNGIMGNSNNNNNGNNNSPDVANHMTQITATDFSTSNIKHNNNNNNSVLNNNSLNNNNGTPPMKDMDRHSDNGEWEVGRGCVGGS